MTRYLLHRAADEVEATSEQFPDPATRTRMSTLADQLRAQADRDAPPALGTLARVQYVLREIAADTDDEMVRDHLEKAQSQLVSFLETLDDRGMTRHGWDQNTDSNDPAWSALHVAKSASIPQLPPCMLFAERESARRASSSRA